MHVDERDGELFLNLSSREAGREDLARAKREEMDGFEASCSEARVHSY